MLRQRLAMISILGVLIALLNAPSLAQDFCKDLSDLDCVLLNQALSNTAILSNTYDSAYINLTLNAALQTTTYGETALSLLGAGPIVRRSDDDDLLNTDFDLNLRVEGDLPEFGGWFRVLVRSLDGVVYTRLPLQGWRSTPIPDIEDLQDNIVTRPETTPEAEATPEVTIPTQEEINNTLNLLLGGLTVFADIPGYITVTRGPDSDAHANFTVLVDSRVLFGSNSYNIIANRLDEPTLGIAPLLPLLFEDGILQLHMLVDEEAVRVDVFTLRADATLNLQSLLAQLGDSPVGTIDDLIDTLPAEPVPATLALSLALSDYNQPFDIIAPPTEDE